MRTTLRHRISVLDEHGITHVVIPILALVILALLGVRVAMMHNDAKLNTPPKSVITTIVANNADNGKTLDVQVGQQIDVVLSNSAWTFSQPTNEQVLKFLKRTTTVATSADPSGTATAVYTVLSSGTSIINASAVIRPVCTPKMACPMYIALAHYTLQVIAAKT